MIKPPSLNSMFVIARFVHFFAITNLFGGSFFYCFLAHPRLRPILAVDLKKYLTISAFLALLSTLFLYSLEAGLIGNGWPDTAAPAIWLAMLTTQLGKTWFLVLFLSSLACIVIYFLPRSMLLLLFLATAACIGTALVGHAAIHSGWLGILHRICAAVHLIAVSYWLGCLVFLWRMLAYLKTDPSINQACLYTLKRFSWYGHLAVILVFITGIGNILFIVPFPYDFNNLYIQLLSLKIIFVLAMVMIAIYNRYFLLPKWPLVDISTPLVQQIINEWSLSLIVLALVSYFAMLMP